MRYISIEQIQGLPEELVNPHFLVRKNNNPGNGNTIIFSFIEINEGNCYSPLTGIFLEK